MFTKEEKKIINSAKKILKSKINSQSYFEAPEAVKNYLQLSYADTEHEVFSILFLTNRHQLIKHAELFRGTIDGASVYPREIVKEALKQNAAALILVHNHPSGNTTPSQADKAITSRIKNALDLIEVRVIDHVIVSINDTFSFAEHGYL